MRAFVAVHPDEEARGDLADVAPLDADGIRVTDMADWHVTVRFLGEIDDDLVPQVADATARAFAAVPPLTIRLGPTTALGPGGKVLFVPAQGVEPLAAALDEAIGALVQPRDHPFRGHLTLARAGGRGRLASSLSGEPVAVAFRVTEAVLMSSSLEPDRAVHQVVRRFELGGG